MLPSCAGVRRLTPLLCALFVLQTLFASSLVAAYEHADCFATLNSADPLFYSVDLRNGERGGSVSDWRVKTYVRRRQRLLACVCFVDVSLHARH